MTRRAGRMTRLIERRRRRERIAGVALAALGVVVLVVAIIALRDPNGGRNVRAGTHVASSSGTRTASSSPKTTAKSTPTTTSPATTATSTSTSSSGTSDVPKLPLVVLNNTTTTGLAQQAAARFTAGGWTVTRYDNYQNDILSTCAYYDPSVSGAEAAAEALQAQYPTIKRVVAQFASLAQYNSPIVVVLTPDYSPN